MSVRLGVALAAVLALGVAGEAGAWGSSGHRMVGVAAMQALPGELPDFLREAGSATAVGELSREPDRSRNSLGSCSAYDRLAWHAGYRLETYAAARGTGSGIPVFSNFANCSAGTGRLK